MTHKDAGQAGSVELRAALYAAGCALADQAARTKGAASFELGDTRDAFKARAADEAAKAIAVLELADSHASISAEKEALQQSLNVAACQRDYAIKSNAANFDRAEKLSAENATLREQINALRSPALVLSEYDNKLLVYCAEKLEKEASAFHGLGKSAYLYDANRLRAIASRGKL